MMGAAFYVMAILGCADDEAACQDVRIVETRYATTEACAAATSDMLIANSDIAWPVLMAQCRPANAAMADVRKVLPGG